jgi:hypothetical protein
MAKAFLSFFFRNYLKYLVYFLLNYAGVFYVFILLFFYYVLQTLNSFSNLLKGVNFWIEKGLVYQHLNNFYYFDIDCLQI